jgi:hypothetical protein
VTTDLRGVSGVPGRFEGVLIARNAHAVVLIETGGEGLVVVDRAAGRWVSFKTPAPIAGEHVHLFGATAVATIEGPDTRWAVGVACGGDGGPWRTDLPERARLLWADDEMLWLGRDGQIVLRRWSVDGAREHGDALGQQEGGGPERKILLPKGPLVSPVRLQPMRSCPDLAGGR